MPSSIPPSKLRMPSSGNANGGFIAVEARFACASVKESITRSIGSESIVGPFAEGVLLSGEKRNTISGQDPSPLVLP